MASDYAGDMSSAEAWRQLEQDDNAQLIDVRTRAEWTFIGVPDLSNVGREPLLIEWQRFPDGGLTEDFTEQLMAHLGDADRDMTLLFLCRSGGRSREAARAMAAAGFTRCFNIADGFEGPLDETRHRGTVAGWKAAELPWIQS